MSGWNQLPLWQQLATNALLALGIYLAAGHVAFERGGRRAQLVWIYPLLVLDCIGSWIVGESFQNTLSAKAWDARVHPRFGWTQRFIDAMFGADHCWVQWERERHYGSVWASWRAEWRGEIFKVPQARTEG